MMLIKNTVNRYGLIAMLFHWVMAVLIITMLAIGLYMVRLPLGMLKLKLFRWHKELGVLILGMVFLRLFWRFLNILPSLPHSIPNWQQYSAKLVHYIFYFFMFAIPLTGWMLSSAAGLPVSFFGLFVLPDLILPNENLRIVFSQIHEYLAYGLIAFLILHTLAALQHHFIEHNDILRRMLP